MCRTYAPSHGGPEFTCHDAHMAILTLLEAFDSHFPKPLSCEHWIDPNLDRTRKKYKAVKTLIQCLERIPVSDYTSGESLVYTQYARLERQKAKLRSAFRQRSRARPLVGQDALMGSSHDQDPAGPSAQPAQPAQPPPASVEAPSSPAPTPNRVSV